MARPRPSAKDPAQDPTPKLSVPFSGSGESPQRLKSALKRSQSGKVSTDRSNLQVKIQLSSLSEETLSDPSFCLGQRPSPGHGKVLPDLGDDPVQAACSQLAREPMFDLDPDGSENAFWDDFFEIDPREVKEMLGN